MQENQNTPNTQQNNQETLRIVQYNTHNSDPVQIPFLHKAAKEKIQIIAIQEPSLNKYTKGTATHPDYWTAISPSGKARICFYISKEIKTNQWQVNHHSDHISTLRLQLKDRAIHIHNVYNQPLDSYKATEAPTIMELKGILQEEEETILVGDFNLHHKSWNAATKPNSHADAYKLVQCTEQANMRRATPQGLTTWERGDSKTTIDLTFISRRLYPALINCDRSDDLDTNSDHYPVRTEILTTALQKEDNKRRQWKKADWPSIRAHIKKIAKECPNPETPQEIDQNIRTITNAIQEAVNKHTPWAKPSTRANPAWTQEVETLIQEARKARREATDHNPWNIIRYKQLTNTKKRALRRGKSLAWRKFIAETTQKKGLWHMAKWAKTKANQPQTTPQFPPLQEGPDTTPTFDNTTRARILAKKFFPPPEEADLSNIQGYTYPQEIDVPQEVTEEMIKDALRKMHPDKAPGPDGITNRVLKECIVELAPVLVPTFNMCAKLGYHPKPFREGCTIAIRKPDKPSYTVAAGYRPIALLNTMGKLLEAVIATEISKITEKHHLLPDTQMGARPNKSTLTALTLATEIIHGTWKKNANLVATMLNLDLAGAFDKVVHERVLHSLRARRVPEWIVRYIKSFLSERTTTIKFGEHISEPIAVKSGIPQGSTLSPILFLFFAAELIEKLNKNNTFAFGFVDDTSLMAIGHTTAQTTRILTEAHTKCQEWAQGHGAKFEPDKYKLIHFTRQPKKHNLKATVDIPGFNEGPVPSLKMLGVILDARLNWKPHAATVRAKLTTTVQAINRLTASTWGATHKRGQQLYKTSVRPVITYGSSVWHTPEGITGHSKPNLAKLATFQNECLRRITGAYKATPIPELQHEAGIPAIDTQIEAQILSSQISQASTEETGLIEKECKRIDKMIWKPKGSNHRKEIKQTPHRAKQKWAREILEELGEGQKNSGHNTTKDERKKYTQKFTNRKEETRWKLYQEKERRGRGKKTAAKEAAWDAKIDQLHAQLTKAQSALAIQIRTEKIGFRDFLYQRKVPSINGPWCDCQRGRQTAKHIIAYCTKYSTERSRMYEQTGLRDYTQTVSTAKGLKIVTRWIIKSGMLEQFRRAAELLNEEESEEQVIFSEDGP